MRIIIKWIIIDSGLVGVKQQPNWKILNLAFIYSSKFSKFDSQLVWIILFFFFWSALVWIIQKLHFDAVMSKKKSLHNAPKIFYTQILVYPCTRWVSVIESCSAIYDFATKLKTWFCNWNSFNTWVHQMTEEIWPTLEKLWQLEQNTTN